VGQETTLPVYVRAGWRYQRLRLDLFGGVAVGGQVTLEDDDGDQVQTSGYDPAPILGLNGQFVF